MIYLLSLKLWSHIDSYVENKTSVNKVLISRMKERPWSVFRVLWKYIEDWMIFVVSLPWKRDREVYFACFEYILKIEWYLLYHYLEILKNLIFQIFLWINQLKMFNHDLRESRVWIKFLYFDQLCSGYHMLNKLDNHFIILYLFYLQKFE